MLQVPKQVGLRKTVISSTARIHTSREVKHAYYTFFVSTGMRRLLHRIFYC